MHGGNGKSTIMLQQHACTILTITDKGLTKAATAVHLKQGRCRLGSLPVSSQVVLGSPRTLRSA